MRRALLALPLTLLAACGESSDPPPPLYAGFAPAAGTAIVFPAADCNITGVGLASVTGLALELTDFPGVCEFATAVSLCGSKQDSTFVVGVAARVSVLGTAPDVAPGTYPVLTGPPASSAFSGALGQAVKTDATCTARPGTSLPASGGSITIAAITADRVTGSLDLRFTDGSAYTQPFDLARCAPPAPVCVFLPGGSCSAGGAGWTCVP